MRNQVLDGCVCVNLGYVSQTDVIAVPRLNYLPVMNFEAIIA